MTQVVQTIHTYQTSAGPSLEAHFSDPNFGDVRMIVTGRAGEIVQAQLVVRDRVAADAINTAAARMHAAGDGLSGVSVTVRSEGGTSTGGRSGSNAFESAGWASGGGYAAGGGPGGSAGHGQGPGNGEAAVAGNATGGEPGSGSRGAPKPAPVTRPEPDRLSRPAPGTSLPGGSSLDIRA
jgi:hypothetical protein